MKRRGLNYSNSAEPTDSCAYSISLKVCSVFCFCFLFWLRFWVSLFGLYTHAHRHTLAQTHTLCSFSPLAGFVPANSMEFIGPSSARLAREANKAPVLSLMSKILRLHFLSLNFVIICSLLDCDKQWTVTSKQRDVYDFQFRAPWLKQVYNMIFFYFWTSWFLHFLIFSHVKLLMQTVMRKSFRGF